MAERHGMESIHWDDSSIAAPALISYMGVLIMAWTGTDGERHLNIASSKDEGRTWTKVASRIFFWVSPEPIIICS
jgi:hypothetical protein